MPMRSQAQRRFLWATDPVLSREFEDKTPKGKKLPEHVKKAFVMGFKKIADNLPEEARNLVLAPMQDHVAGSTLNDSKETAQSRGRATRTSGVQNEDREMNPKYKRKWQNSRIP